MLDDVTGAEGVQIALTIDGVRVEVAAGTTLWEAARAAGIEIPVLCHEPRLAPVGVCRLCVVDIGERTLAASCVRLCEPGMEVRTATEEIETHRGVLTELLMADQPPVEEDARATTLGDNALHALADRYDARGESLPAGQDGQRPADASSAVIAVDHQACIL
ncbi:MAG: 2Fe-2S iron-sulfur cluster-binding protein, partial [Planctomycetota bacterium]|nr:2Fe-2S iron-sulfur cluster-binding protein [Planctomycetota bacterium]